MPGPGYAVGPHGHRPPAALTAQAYDVLAGEAAERGRTPVLTIDEAHLLDHPQLESVHMLTNHEMDLLQPLSYLAGGRDGTSIGLTMLPSVGPLQGRRPDTGSSCWP